MRQLWVPPPPSPDGGCREGWTMPAISVVVVSVGRWCLDPSILTDFRDQGKSRSLKSGRNRHQPPDEVVGEVQSSW
ncbi:hypothetical protein CRG98_023640 [Punica granatum]|uniref:Uncharacterized protein n=1 Tax=Punica granatum TaxID=22663 RepID=A0A2I0JI77_PUNGR|nr:hypothetical protein CRG98_023640 [Punica granatum]